MTCHCGCWQGAERAAMDAKLAAERRADFARYLLDRPTAPKPPVEPDHETSLLALTHWTPGQIAVPVVRRTS